MHTLRCIAAEWDIVRARLFHTRLGAWLLLLAVALTWSAQDEVSLVRVAVRTGLVAGVLCAAFAAGSEADRAAFRLSLAHPTSPLALATGRWLAAAVAAALPVAGVTATAAITHGSPPRVVFSAAIAGFGAAAAVGGAALPAIVLGGNTVAGVVLALLAVSGATLDPSTAGSLALWHVLGPIAGVLATAAILARRQ